MPRFIVKLRKQRFGVVCCLLFVVCCLLFVVCCLLVRDISLKVLALARRCVRACWFLSFVNVISAVMLCKKSVNKIRD